jgi:hypothetical protein
MAMTWIVHATGNPRFPFRVAVERDGETLFAVRAQDAWPGAKGRIFCVRDSSPADERSLFEEVERVPVARFERFGKRISLVLDRPTRKRCEFLVLEKERKDGSGSYEQIFFCTQAARSEHRSNAKLSIRGAEGFSVVIDSAEKYPWRFPKAETRRARLAAGDYALEVEGRIEAAVERKTFDNMLNDFARLKNLHQALGELECQRRPAMVIEARYGDFMDPKKLEGRYKPGYAYRVMAELHAMHPGLPIIYAGTRKEANLWAYGYFRACARMAELEGRGEGTGFAADEEPEYRADERLDELILAELGACEEGLLLKALAARIEGADASLLRAALCRLRKAGKAATEGRGSGTRWRKA